MIRNVITDIGGVGIYGVISISLFFIVFVGMLLWAFLQKQSVLTQQSRLPLEDGVAAQPAKGDRHHE